MKTLVPLAGDTQALSPQDGHHYRLNLALGAIVMMQASEKGTEFSVQNVAGHDASLLLVTGAVVPLKKGQGAVFVSAGGGEYDQVS